MSIHGEDFDPVVLIQGSSGRTSLENESLNWEQHWVEVKLPYDIHSTHRHDKGPEKSCRKYLIDRRICCFPNLFSHRICFSQILLGSYVGGRWPRRWGRSGKSPFNPTGTTLLKHVKRDLKRSLRKHVRAFFSSTKKDDLTPSENKEPVWFLLLINKGC